MKNISKYLNVLIVEDNLEIQENLKQSLELFFKNVYTANNGIEALKIYEKSQVDLIISDYIMPKMDAYEFISIIRENDNKTPIILLSSFMDIDKLQKCIPLNLVHFLEKPIPFDKLLEQIYLAIEKIDTKANTEEFRENIIYNISKKELIVDKEIIELSIYEAKLLELLFEYKKEIVSFEQITSYLYNPTEIIDKTTIKNIIYRLRKKLVYDDIIITHRNLGYSLNI